MSKPPPSQKRFEAWGLLGMGLLLLAIALFTDPVGASPDTGVLDLGSRGAKWLLGLLGGACVLAAAFAFVRSKKSDAP